MAAELHSVSISGGVNFSRRSNLEKLKMYTNVHHSIQTKAKKTAALGFKDFNK